MRDLQLCGVSRAEPQTITLMPTVSASCYFGPRMSPAFMLQKSLFVEASDGHLSALDPMRQSTLIDTRTKKKPPEGGFSIQM